MPSSMGEITAMANGAGASGAGPGFISHHSVQQHQQGLMYPIQLDRPQIDRCSGCGVVDSSLLACDDLDRASSNNKDGLPAIGDPSQRQRFCPNCVIGKKVRVFWPVDHSWYIGTVQQYNAASGEHLLKYEDDDTEWVQIGESNTTMNPSDLHPQHLPPNQPQTVVVQSQSNGIVTMPETSSSSIETKIETTSTAVSVDGNAAQTDTNPKKNSGIPSSSKILPNVTSAANTSEPQSARLPATGPGSGTETSSNALHPSYRPYGAVPPPGSAYPPPSTSGQHHLPPHLSHHQSHHPHHGYSHGLGGPPQPPSSLYGGPGGFSSASHGHGPTLSVGYGYPGHHGMGGPQRHGSSATALPHHYGGIHGHPSHPHGLQGAPPATAAPGSGKGASGNGKKKTGPKAWTKEEDSLLLSIVQSMRIPMKWSLVAQNLSERTGKQCRERYVNHLNPRLKVTDWNPTEDATIFHLYNTIGSHWAKMSKIIPGRTDNGIKNRFHNLRRQLEREDEHRLRLNASRDFPEEIRLELIREFPKELRGKAAELWDIKSGLSVLAAQSVLGGDRTRTAGRFGPFREAEAGTDICVRCGFMLPSVQTGSQVCTKTGWCQSCARIPPHVSGNMLRECLNLRRCQNAEKRKVIESWKLTASSTQ